MERLKSHLFTFRHIVRCFFLFKVRTIWWRSLAVGIPTGRCVQSALLFTIGTGGMTGRCIFKGGA